LENLSTFDYSIMVVYFLALIGVGFYLKKRASASVEDYFIGGRKLPWWALGLSGMASFLDITGTMVIVSFLYLLGPRGIYIAFRGGAVLALAIMMLWTGKWHRRSQCITNAEWMLFRFGTGAGGQFARVVSAISRIIASLGLVAYLVKGVGLFLSMFLPFSPFYCSLLLIGVASIYTIASGFYGVVFTDILQSAIIVAGVITITIIAVLCAGDEASLSALAYKVTGNSSWTSSIPHWQTHMPAGYEAYKHLVLFAMFYLMRRLVGGLGTGGDPRFFGARSDRDCGVLAFLWTWMMTFRWPLMISFAVLGIFLVNDFFPDQTVLTQAAELIKGHLGDIDKSRWADAIAGIMNHPQEYSSQLIGGIRDLLGQDWQNKLSLLNFEGTVNAERILPAVLLFKVPRFLRGLLLIALIAASMSSFDTLVNNTTGFFTRDIYQGYIRRKAGNKELIFASRAFIVIFVAAGFLFGYTVRSINDIWVWMVMGLTSGLMMPGILRFYWWRFNGGGFVGGIIAGMSCAILQRILLPGLDERLMFAILALVGLGGAVAGTYLTVSVQAELMELSAGFINDGTGRPFKWQ